MVWQAGRRLGQLPCQLIGQVFDASRLPEARHWGLFGKSSMKPRNPLSCVPRTSRRDRGHHDHGAGEHRPSGRCEADGCGAAASGEAGEEARHFSAPEPRAAG